MSVVLSEHLPLLASAPDGIQKLRGLILELAVRGKLVPQDLDDEPASELLKRIAVEKTLLAATGEIRKEKASLPLGEDERPFAVPASWEWIRLTEALAVVTDGDHQPPPKADSGVPFLVIGNLNSGLVSFDGCRFVPDHYFEDLDWSKRPTSGDLLYTVTGSFGIAVPVTTNAPFCVQRHVAILKTVRSSPASYLLKYLQSLSAKSFSQEIATGTAQKTVPLSGLRQMPIALPPLAEQHRIVAKVDELMALCDRLEAEQTDAEAAHAKLVETLLGTLTQSTDVADLAANWQRLAEHFDTLFATEASIDALKQTVLQLAVMGKLVPQDPNDEAASDLLRRMQKGRRLKRKCSVIDIDSLESPLPEIPSGWFWTVVDQVAADHENSIADGPFGANLKTEHYISEVGYRVVRLQNIGYGDFRGEHHAYVTQERYLSLQKHHVYAGDLVVAGLVDDRVRCCELPKTIGHALVKADCYRFSVHPEVCSAYALHYLNSPLSSDFAAAHHHGMTLTRIGLGNFRQIPFPLPPQAEQRRIVAKVDELIVLCDHLKADLTTSRLRQARLTDTLIESALEAA